jgi:hypothetical protein
MEEELEEAKEAREVAEKREAQQRALATRIKAGRCTSAESSLTR